LRPAELAAVPAFRPSLVARLGFLAVLFVAEKILLNSFVDFDLAQAATGVGALVRIAQHWGFRYVVAFAAAIALLAYVNRGESIRAAAASIRAAPIRVAWFFAHALLIAALMPVSYLLYRHTASDLSLAAVASLWTLVGFAAALSALLAMAPATIWLGAARALGSIRWYAAIAALLGTAAMQSAQMLWRPTAALTFKLVSRLLAPVIPSLAADPVTLVLSTDRFAVQIADICSGLEGVGLMLAFCGAWLIYFRRDYIFPRALLLIPVGVLAIYALNVVRIATLVLIGNAGYADVAVYGFHSQAGWIAFNAVACGLVFLSRRSTWLNRSAEPTADSVTAENPTAAFLMPLLAILAAGTVSRAMSSDFEFLYPLRFIAALGALVYFRRQLAALDWHFTWRGPALGAAVFLIWIAAAHFLLAPAAMPGKLAALSAPLKDSWIAVRVTAAVFTVPVAEELAYRGYLMRRLTHREFDSVPFGSVRWPAVAISAVVFGVAHGALWLPGIIAGLAFGWLLVRTGRIGESVVAHALANGFIAVAVLGANQWQLW
jgi:exosortase E/protease (VPEID-CTERM system)